MGLDITIGIDNDDEVFTFEYITGENSISDDHHLSRTFCNLICRDAVIDHETELNQISRITGVDIEPLYLMLEYPNSDELEFMLENAETEEERQEIIEESEHNKLKLTNNIDTIYQTITHLINKLNTIQNLSKLLIKTDFDSLNNDVYFSDFNTDKDKENMRDIFENDLNNFKSLLEYCKARNTKTVFFNFM